MQAIQIPTVGYEPLSRPVAPVSRRVAAGAIDLILLGGYLVGWMLYVDFAWFPLLGSEDLSKEDSPLWYLALLPALLYSWWVPMVMDGQTLGMRLLRIRILTETGRVANLFQLGLRWAMRPIDIWLGAMILLPGLPAALVGFFTPYGQGLGDVLAGTLLIFEPVYTPKEMPGQAEEANYIIQYPEVVQLSDRDIAILKEILTRGKREGAYLDRLADRVSQVMDVRPRHSSKEFLQTVLRDYHFYFTHQEENV